MTAQIMFLSTPPSRVATVGWAIAHPFTLCFYPRHPRGWRQPPEAGTAEAGEFLSTPPSLVATRVHLAALRQCVRFYPRHPRGWRPRTTFCILAHPFRFYPRHPRGWRPLVHGRQGRALRVSIHATLAGGDALCTFRSAGRAQVSIHATLAGGDNALETELAAATRFYPRHPRGWRRGKSTITVAKKRFYPRHPRGWRLDSPLFAALHNPVSIHATLAGGDYLMPLLQYPLFCFYPRHPRGWRPARRGCGCTRALFLSTPPSRVATSNKVSQSSGSTFLSTPPSRVATIKLLRREIGIGRFYPRHPRGWRQQRCFTLPSGFKFLSTPPSRVAT